VDWLPGGFIGVDVFYVISGYLISTIIIEDPEFSFTNFYARRAKRLLPAAYLVLLVTAIAFWFIAPTLSKAQFAKDLFASTWYFSNYNFAFWQNDYQNLGSNPSPLIHFWSLAVEEQFYLLWPLLLMTFVKFRRSMVLLTMLVSFGLSLIVLNYLPIWSFYSLPTRAFELVIGAALAIFRITFASKILSYLGIALIALVSFIFDSGTAFPGFPALIPTIAAGLIITNRASNALLSLPISQKIGDWSYSIYLWHWPLIALPGISLNRELKELEKSAILLISILIGFLSYRLVENPIRIRSMSPTRVLKYTFLFGALLSAIAILMFISGRSVESNKSIQEMRKQPVIYADGCQLDKRETTPNPRCVYGDRQANRSVVLVGDSHAAQWFPAIDQWARLKGFRLVVMTKSSCPASSLPLKSRGNFNSAICETFRTNAFNQINRIAPELVIAGSAENHKNIPVNSYNVFPTLKYPDAKLLILKDTPWPNQDIPTCLSKDPSGAKCTTKAPDGINYSGRDTFDPIPLLCKAGICPAKLGKSNDLVAYRDHSHISVALALDLSDELGAKLDEIVAR
jgi:peptidoglycan/LPS O-acetylase OafA/YrhL